MLYNQLKKL